MNPSPYNCSQEHYLSSMLTLTGAERIIKDLIRFMKKMSQCLSYHLYLTPISEAKSLKSCKRLVFSSGIFFVIKRRVKV